MKLIDLIKGIENVEQEVIIFQEDKGDIDSDIILSFPEEGDGGIKEESLEVKIRYSIDMNLSELIMHLINPTQLEMFCRQQGSNVGSEALLIYMKGSLSLDSEITILGIEETGDDIIFEKNGVRYIQLFPLDYAVELIKSDLDLKDKGYSYIEIAQRLLEFREKDA